jgi:hypothetical protein
MPEDEHTNRLCAVCIRVRRHNAVCLPFDGVGKTHRARFTVHIRVPTLQSLGTPTSHAATASPRDFYGCKQ